MLRDKFYLHFSSNILRMAIHTLAGIVVARLAGPEVLGIVNYGTSYVAVFGVILGLFGPSHTKAVSEGRNLGDCIKTYAILQSGLIVIYGLLFFAVQWGKSYHAQAQGHLTTQQIVILILFASSFIHFFINIITGTFGARTELAKQSIPYLAEGVIHSVLRVIVAILGLGAIALASTSLVTTIIIIPVVLLLFKGYPIGKFDPKLAKYYLGSSFFFFIIHASTTIMHNYGRVFLGNHNSAREVGIFSGGYNLAGILIMVATTAGTVFFPTFSRLLAENKKEMISRQIYRFHRFLLVFVMPPVTVISVFSAQLITLVLGKKYLDSIPVLSILMISSFIIIFGLPFANIVTGAGKLKAASLLSILQVAVFIASLYVFVGEHMLNMGSKGLAIVMLITQLFSAIVFYLASRKTVKFHMQAYVFKYLCLGVSGYLALWFISRLVQINAWLAIATAVVYLIVFYTVSYLLKLAEFNDLKYLYAMIKPSSSMNYIRDEIGNSVDRDQQD